MTAIKRRKQQKFVNMFLRVNFLSLLQWRSQKFVMEGVQN